MRLHMAPHMTAATLSACLQQVAGDEDVVGLYVDRSPPALFVTLEHIVSNPEVSSKEVYSLKPRPRPPPEESPWPSVWVILGVLLAIVAVYYHELMLHSMASLWSFLFHSMIEAPLREFYRYGPRFVGWEGESLPRICASITYHGDVVFWRQNLAECERIYAAKEEAWLRMARPGVYVVLMFALVFVVRMILQEVLGKHHPPGPPTDRDMVETYRAFQVLLRQIRRAIQAPQHHRHDERQRPP